ncbi:hypothetical protein, partial [Roseinatronobacter sp.]|uniref:hypothetical protein n=1 Tax=Roseinatronobacter sp. TaxID=1945755 RepID=UPI0025D065C9
MTDQRDQARALGNFMAAVCPTEPANCNLISIFRQPPSDRLMDNVQPASRLNAFAHQYATSVTGFAAAAVAIV